MGRGVLTVLLALSPSAWACEPTTAVVREIEAAVLEARLERLGSLQARVDASVACGAPMPAELVARLWLAEGAAHALLGDEKGSMQAFLAAWRADPDLWNADLGPQLRATYDRAVSLQTDASGRIAVLPESPAWVVRLDGRPVTAESTQTAGLHVVQVHPPDGEVRFGKHVVLLPGQRLVLDTGLPLAPAVAAPVDPGRGPSTVIVRRSASRPVGLLVASAGSIGLATLSGVLYATQDGAMRRAADLDALDAARDRQVGFGAAGMALGAVGAVGLTVTALTW